jgi:hypothetical protein
MIANGLTKVYSSLLVYIMTGVTSTNVRNHTTEITILATSVFLKEVTLCGYMTDKYRSTLNTTRMNALVL